jgi:hypothetical protein
MIRVVDQAATLKPFFKFAFTSACDQTRDSGQPCVFTKVVPGIIRSQATSL